MTKNDILRLLEAYKDGGITKEDAAESLSKAAFEDSFWPLQASSAGKDGCWDWPDGNFPPK